MCPSKGIRYLLTGALCLAALRGSQTRAQSEPDAERLKVQLERLPLRCNPPLYRAFVTAESGKFSFIIPSGYRTRSDADGKLKLCNLEGNCMITFTVLDPSPCGSDPLNADAYRDVVQSRHPKGKIIEQLCPGAAGRDGVGFDIQWETTNKFAQCSRIAFIPTATGMLEFTATSSPQSFGKVRYELGVLMSAFQGVTPEEKLVVPPVSASDTDRTDVKIPQSDSHGPALAFRRTPLRLS